MKINHLKNKILYIKFIFISFLIIFIYNIFSFFLINISNKGKDSIFLIELPFCILLMSIFYFSKFKSKTLRYIFPAIPVISLYIAFDIFYKFLARIPRYSDFENIMTIYNFYPLIFFLIILYISIILFIIFVIFFKAKKLYSKKKQYITSILLRIIVLIGLLIIIQTKLFNSYQKKFFKYIVWSGEATIKNNGRISSFIFYSNLEIKNKNILKNQSKNTIDITSTLYNSKIKNKQNIYFVVLESFINPNYLKNIKYNQNPISKELNQFLINNDFSHVISPIYGGGTAQAEFELLTGIKAFAKVNAIEFNVLNGKEIKSFLYQLKKYNYRIMATIATNSGFFNSKLAYKSLGFEKVTFLEETKDFKKNKNDILIFDGDLYKYNLKVIKKHFKNSNKPLFTYVLGMYGHLPYKRNKINRPDIIEPINFKNETVKRITNQFYYRTQALAQYIKEILKIDKNAIIVISSDHLPGILNKNIQYKYEKHINIALIINKGKVIHISKKYQYEIPWLIWDILSDKKISRQYNNKILEDIYFKSLYNTQY